MLDAHQKLSDKVIDVDPQKLRSELDRIHNKKQSSSEASSALGHLRKTAAEQLGCHKDALSMIEKIDGMSDDKLADFMRSFQPMYQAMYHQWAERFGDLLDKMQAGDDEMEGDLG